MRDWSLKIRGLTVAQFPNPPLIVALVAAVVGRLGDGTVDDVASSVFYVALTIWAYEEAVNGVNWFRRTLGVGATIYIIVSLARALGA